MPEYARIWDEFAALLRKGPLPVERMRPYRPLSLDTLSTILEAIRQEASWDEWQAPPESHQVGDHVHFVLPLTLGGRRKLFCFTFLLEGEAWYWRHVESILIRLDRLPSLPTSEFPDITEAQKAWIREESRVTEQVRLFGYLLEERGRSAALEWFEDGAGYVLAAKTWVPLVPAAEAFVLYMCWEQAKLRGSRVTLVRLEQAEAVVELKPIWIKLYRETGHLRQQITWADYRQLFETVWRDRARHAGWELAVSYHGERVDLYLTR